MAGKYTRIFRNRWDDIDGWCALSADAQWLYDLLVTQRDITPAGVLPLVERRWASLAADVDATRIGRALTELEVGRYVVIDARTAEVWVRSYIRYDGLVHSPNGLKAIRQAIGQVLSEPIREHAQSAVAAVLNAGAALHNPRSEGPTEAPPEGASGTPTEGDSSSQAAKQPRAVSHIPRSTAAAAAPQTTEALPDVAAAAIEMIIETDIANGRAHNPPGWRKSMPAKYASEHGATMRAYLTTHPQATAPELVRHLLSRSSEHNPPRDPIPWCDRDCPRCAGDAFIDTGNGLAPCPNRTTQETA